MHRGPSTGRHQSLPCATPGSLFHATPQKPAQFNPGRAGNGAQDLVATDQKNTAPSPFPGGGHSSTGFPPETRPHTGERQAGRAAVPLPELVSASTELRRRTRDSGPLPRSAPAPDAGSAPMPHAPVVDSRHSARASPDSVFIPSSSLGPQSKAESSLPSASHPPVIGQDTGCCG